MAPFLPAGSQHFATVGGLHPLAEAMNRLAATSVWLKCTFHSIIFVLSENQFQSGPRVTIPVAGERDGKGKKIVDIYTNPMCSDLKFCP